MRHNDAVTSEPRDVQPSAAGLGWPESLAERVDAVSRETAPEPSGGLGWPEQ